MGKELQTEVTDVVEANNTEIDAGDIDEAIEPESAEESVKIAIQEITGAKSQGDEGEEKKEAVQKVEPESVPRVGRPKKEKQTVQAATEPETQDEDPDLAPHEGLSPKEKALFKKISDAEVKRGVTRILKHYQGAMTRSTQEAHAIKNEASAILETVKPYVDQFTERNLSISQGLGQLLVANKRLINLDDPDGQLKEAARIIQGCQIDPDALYSVLKGQKPAAATASADIENHPYVKKLEAEINSLQERIEPVYNNHQAVAQNATESIFRELEGVQLETTEDGDYVRPELAQDAEFLECWKPLVSRFVKTDKLSWADAGKKAYAVLKGESFSKSVTAKLPAKNNQNRSVSAAVSVRGRTAPITNTRIDDDEIPSGETPLQSVMRAVQGLNSRG